MLTGAALHCGPWPTGFSPVLGWSVMAVKPAEAGGLTGLRRVWTFDKKYQNIIFLHHVQSLTRFETNFCRNRKNFKKSNI
jgi:hypothetical protein